MKKPAPLRDRYFLRDLHQEIDLFDRKLAYLNNHMEFAAPADREEAREKLLAKRALMEKTARGLAASGVQFEDKDLPRSFHAETLEQGGARQNLFLIKRA